MRILFISRAYPPVVGGIENQNYELSQWLPKYTETTTIANRYGKKFLPFFLPYATLRALWLMRTYDVLLLGDGVLSILGWCVKRCYPNKTVVSVIHGLDLTFTSTVYQNFWVKRFIPTLDALIAVGNETIRAGVSRGIPEEKFIFIPNGVDTEKFLAPHTREELERILGISLTDKRILLTSGRLAKRKGVAWFIRNVIPRLPDNVIYVVAGDGPDRENVLEAKTDIQVPSRVILLGYVTDEIRNTLFNTCDLFVQPNIKVDGDMEGFGISVIEAASCELPVIASSLEGLKDAIKNDENGYLVETENEHQYIAIITELLNDTPRLQALKKRVRQYVINHYAWSNIAKQYAHTLEKIAKI